MLGSVSVLLFASVTEAAVQAFVNSIIGLMIFAVLILPVLIIPYIFIKLGSVAGKVQSFVNNTAKGRGVLGKAAQGAASRGIESKAGKWAARNDGSLRSRVGGYKTQRDFKRSQRSAQAKRLQEDALASRIGSDSAYRAAAGGAHAAAVAQGIRDKRLKEEDDNASAVLRGAGIYNPMELEQIVRGRSGRGAGGQVVNGAGDEALQRVAARQIIASQSSDQLNNILQEQSGADYQMVYSEIQKQYSTAKGAGAHFVKFDPSKPEDARGWSERTIQIKAAEAVSSLAPEKIVEQDGGTMASVVQGVSKQLQDLQALRAAPTPDTARISEIEGSLKSLATTIASVKSNVNTYNKAKQPVRSAIDTLSSMPELQALVGPLPPPPSTGTGTPPSPPPTGP